MRTTIELPDSVYRKGEKVARTQGVTIEEFIIRAFERELGFGRSALYGAFLWPGIPLKFWPEIVAQAALVAWLVSRRRRKTVGAPATAPTLAPGEELRLALARLAAAAEDLGDDARDFYSELTYAVKRFLERATGDPVLEWTTFETVRRLREKGIEFPREAAFPDLLASADRVKFGKGAATRGDAREALVKARVVLHNVEARLKAEDAAGAARAAAPKERAS